MMMLSQFPKIAYLQSLSNNFKIKGCKNGVLSAITNAYFPKVPVLPQRHLWRS